MLGFFTKILFLVIAIILIRGSLPRARIDHLTSSAWKTFIFMYLAYFFIVFSALCIVVFLPEFHDPDTWAQIKSVFQYIHDFFLFLEELKN